MSGASAQESVQRNGTLGPTVGKRGRLPKKGARGGTYRPVSNGPVAEQTVKGGGEISPMALGPWHGPRPESAHLSTKVGADALGPGPNRRAASENA